MNDVFLIWMQKNIKAWQFNKFFDQRSFCFDELRLSL